MQSDNQQQPILVQLAEGQREVVILHGEAPKQLDQLKPLKIDIEGTIGSPLAFLQKRVGDINQHKAFIIVNRDDMKIVLYFNEDDPYKQGRVAGRMTFSEIFNKFGINQNKKWEPEHLGQFLKLNRVYFPDREENMKVVNALKSFNAKVQQTVERETKENGNRAFSFRQAVDSNIPPTFKIKIPVMSGSTPVEIDVETYAYVDGGSVSIALQSAGANDIVEGMRCEQIDHEIDELRKVAPDIVIIEQ